ncbi:MAG: MFS transporter [Pseudomonadota bacterium]
MTDRTHFALVFVLWGAGLGAAGQYAKISVIFDRLPEVYPDAGTALGFIVSLVGFVGIVLGVVAGLVVARIRYRRAMLWALWSGAALSAFQATLPALPLLLASRVLEGVSHLALVVAAPTLIAALSAERHRGFTLSLWSTFFSVAFTILVTFGLPLVAWGGVPALFWAHALWMAGFAVILTRFLRPVEAPPPAPLSLSGVLRDHITIYRSPRIAAPGVGWIFYTFCFLAILTVLPPFIPEAWRVFTLAAMPLVSILSSLTLGVFALRYLSAVQVVQLGFVTCAAALIWLWFVPGSPVACVALAAAFGLVQGATFAAVPQLSPTPDEQAQSYGALAQAGNLGNTIGTPALLAVLALSGYGGMILLCAVVLALGAISHALLATRRGLASRA